MTVPIIHDELFIRFSNRIWLEVMLCSLQCQGPRYGICQEQSWSGTNTSSRWAWTPASRRFGFPARNLGVKGLAGNRVRDVLYNHQQDIPRDPVFTEYTSAASLDTVKEVGGNAKNAILVASQKYITAGRQNSTQQG